MKKIVFHPFLLSVYPILALLSLNITQVSLSVAIRPLFVSLLTGSVLFLILFAFTRNWHTAGLIVSLVLILLYSYGHLFQFLRSTPFTTNITHHRFLLSLYLLVFIGGVFLILKKMKTPDQMTMIMNYVAMILVLFVIIQIAFSEITTRTNQRIEQQSLVKSLDLSPQSSGQLHDIYYILLDMHTRQDVLKENYGLDNSRFVDNLRNLGFYVADCSRSNYGETSQSITATLNLNYLDSISSITGETGSENPSSLLIENAVRNSLKELGYKTVAFETEYEWSQMENADYYIAPTKSSILLQSLNPFETLLLDSTALRIYREYTIQQQIKAMSLLNHPWREHIELVKFNLQNLSEVPAITGPKFVFTHILVPHVPFVFAGDGSIRTDPGYWDGNNAFPVDAQHEQDGYAGQVEFIDNQIDQTVQQILENSTTPPIIVIMGDHGFKQEDRNKILYAVYFPDGDYSKLKPTSTPVNTFRIIFDQYFNTSLGLLSNRSFNMGKETFEDSPECVAIK